MACWQQTPSKTSNEHFMYLDHLTLFCIGAGVRINRVKFFCLACKVQIDLFSRITLSKNLNFLEGLSRENVSHYKW
jgi:hypothetical protein